MLMKDKIIRFFIGYENPINLYERSPFLAWLIMSGIIIYGIIGTIVIF